MISRFRALIKEFSAVSTRSFLGKWVQLRIFAKLNLASRLELPALSLPSRHSGPPNPAIRLDRCGENGHGACHDYGMSFRHHHLYYYRTLT
jgi:hypothetical protein